MSLELARKVNAKYPHLLMTNTGESCHTFTQHLVKELRAAGFRAFLMCKTAGEGQYIPLGFQPREVKGLDGKPYMVTGVSHDAIWSEGAQFDTIANANDGPEPLGQPAQPVWNPIPQQYWRAQNPPLTQESIVINPKPVAPQFPSYEEVGGDDLFRARVGVPLEADMAVAGQTLNNGSAVWMSRTCYSILKAKLQDRNADVEPIIKAHRNEWRAILGQPPL